MSSSSSQPHRDVFDPGRLEPEHAVCPIDRRLVVGKPVLRRPALDGIDGVAVVGAEALDAVKEQLMEQGDRILAIEEPLGRIVAPFSSEPASTPPPLSNDGVGDGSADQARRVHAGISPGAKTDAVRPTGRVSEIEPVTGKRPYPLM